MTNFGCQISVSETPIREYSSTIHIVFSDPRESGKIEAHLRREGFSVRCFPDGESLLAAPAIPHPTSSCSASPFPA